jgi:hypothetical protein
MPWQSNLCISRTGRTSLYPLQCLPWALAACCAAQLSTQPGNAIPWYSIAHLGGLAHVVNYAGCLL